MIIDTKQIISMTEANQNFSKASKTADLYGKAIIVKNNKPSSLTPTVPPVASTKIL